LEYSNHIQSLSQGIHETRDDWSSYRALESPTMV
jgi:hypothetical protein